jgi:hypothetical protein
MARSRHGTVRGRRLRLARSPRLVLVAVAVRPAGRRWTDIANPSSPERRCHMARLRIMLLTLAVAALLLVGTASSALAGITMTGVD